jgi:uncharacterized protein with FMN-binding domain
MQKKYLAPIIVVVIFLLYLGYRQIGTKPGPDVIIPQAQVRNQSSNNATATGTNPPFVLPPTAPTPVVATPPAQPVVSPAAPATQAAYKDGVYTGDVADAGYGPVQAQALVQGGKITDVQFLQYPGDRQRSVAIYEMAAPTLKQEVIQAQNANIDLVSGATQTSSAFRVSLSSALAKAQ